eukprot:9080072-Alexandrium_andersonii.AAC.1
MCIRDSSLTFDPKPTPTRGGLAIAAESVADVQGILISAAAAAESLNGPRAFTRAACEYISRKLADLKSQEAGVKGTPMDADTREALQAK